MKRSVYAREYLDDIITVDSDAICAAMKDLFEDVRAVAEPSGALALAGMKKYIAQHNIRGERLAHILSGANVNSTACATCPSAASSGNSAKRCWR